MSPSPEFLIQHAALTKGAGLADVSDRTRLEVRGSDRISFLHNFCTNDIKKLVPGHGCEAFITSPQGKTLGHVLVFCEADQLWIDTSPGQANTLIAHFNRYVLTEDVEFSDRTVEWGELLVGGEQAHQTLRHLLASEPPADRLTTAQGRIAGYEVLVCPVDYAGPSSFFIRTSRDNLPHVTDAVLTAGAIACGLEAVNAARLEAGFPLFGQDISEDNLPQEVGRDAKAISFTKGCYLGQETVARIDALGHVNRLLVGLKFDGIEIPAAGTPLLAEDKEVGRVTSAAWSPILNTPLAMAYVRRIHAVKGKTLASPLGPAEVIELPVAGPLPEKNALREA